MLIEKAYRHKYLATILSRGVVMLQNLIVNPVLEFLLFHTMIVIGINMVVCLNEKFISRVVLPYKFPLFDQVAQKCFVVVVPVDVAILFDVCT